MDASQCVSIDFIPQVLDDDDEAECIRDDQERKRQVKEGLDTMFADMEMHDFENAEEEDEEEEVQEEEELEDGGYLEDNNRSDIDGREHAVESFDDVGQSQIFEGEPVMSDGPRNWPSNHPWPMMSQGVQQTSTPRGDYPPPALSTPSTVPRGYYSAQQVALYRQSVDTSDVEPDYVAPTDHEEESPYWIHGEDGQQFDFDEQGGMVGTDINYHDPVSTDQQNMAVYHPDQFIGSYPQAFPMAYITNGVYQSHQGIYHEGAYNLIHEAQTSAAFGGNFHPTPYPSMTPTLPVNRDDFRSEVEATFTEGELELAGNEAQSMPPIRTVAKSGLRSPVKLSTLQASGRDGGLDNYKVRFSNLSLSGGSDGDAGRHRRETDALELSESIGVESPTANPQENYLLQDGSRESHQMTQLQILYNARGKRIEELTKELESVKDELSREIRLLKHELSLARGQWDGATNSLEECQQLLTEAMTSKSRAEGQVAALQLQIASLKNDNEELTKKIISTESMIESLNSQLSEPRSTDNWTRAKQHYETTIATLKHKNESEILRMKQQMDDMTHHVETKNEEVASLRKQVVDITKESELAQISRAEAINRLARSLHDSQDQCNQLLQSGAGQELSRLKLQLQDVLAGKSFAEDMNSALQSELQELKEQVTMYESMSQFGLLSAPGGSISSSRPGCFSPPIDPDDSYALLGIKNPHPMRGDSEMSSTTEMLSGLKNELERCVKLYRDKRLQVAALQAELKSTKSNLADVAGKLELATRSLQESETKLLETSECRPGQGIAEKRLERELEKISKEEEELVRELQELQIRLEEASLSEQQATELCRDLSRLMSDLVKEHDEDKRQTEANQKLALKRCQAAMLEHHERAKEQTRQAIMEESEEKMEKLRQELEALEQELDETKRLYVEACEKRDEVEEEVNKKWQAVLREQLEQLRLQMISEKEEDLERLRSTLTTDAVAMTTENAKWLQEQQKRLEMEMDARLSKAEDDWKRSHKAETEEAIRCAEDELKRQMEQAFDVRMKEELDKAVEKCQSDLRSKFQSEIEAGVDRARDEWQSTEMAEWKAEQLELELERARDAWQSNELATELSRAKDEWMKSMRLKDTTLQAKAVAEAKAKWEKDELSVAVEKAKQEVRGQIEIRSAQLNTLNARYELTRMSFDGLRRDVRDNSYLSIHQFHSDYRHIQRAGNPFCRVSVTTMVRAALEKEWMERSDAVAVEHSHQVAALQAQHKEELAKALDAAERQWHQKMEAALKEMDSQAKAAKQELLQLADEHNKSEIAKHESTFQKRLTARVAEYEQRLTAVLHDNDNLQEQLHLIQTFAEQQEQLATDFEEAKTRWSDELDEIRSDLEKSIESLRTSENKRNELEKEMENLRQMVERAEEEKSEALRKKEEDIQIVLANYQRQVELLSDKLGRAERVFKGLEAKTQKRLSGLQDSLEREHASALAQLEARLVDQSREQDLAMEEMRQKHAEEVKTLKEELEQEKRKKGELQGLQATQVEALQEMRDYYLQAIAKVKDEVFRHLEQSSKQNAEVLRQKLMRERRRTARHLRKYYLRCFDQLLQRDFDSSFRSYALQAMQNLLDNMSDRDSSPNSLFSSASELTTPRDNVAPPGVGPTSLQTTPASFSDRPLVPSVATGQMASGASLAGADVGHFDSPWSNASSAKSSFRKLPQGGVQADYRTQRREFTRLEASQVDSVTPTPDNQLAGDACQQNNLYFESPSRKSRERLGSTAQFENEAVDGEGLGSNQEATYWNPEALSRDSKALKQNKGVPEAVSHDPKSLKQNEGDFGLPGSTEPGLGRYYETPNSSSRKVVSSLTNEGTALPSGATGRRHMLEKSRAAQETLLLVSSLKPRSDAVFISTRSAAANSVQRPATVAVATNNKVSTKDAAFDDDNSKSSARVGMATKSKKTDDENNEYVYTSLSQRLLSTTNSQKTGQFSTLKSWSVSDLTRSADYTIPKTPHSTAVSSVQMASAVCHSLMATSSSRPLATSSLSNIPSLSSSDSQTATTKSPFSYSNFSLSATSHKPAATSSMSHMPFTTPPVSHTSASSHIPPTSFNKTMPSIQDHVTGTKVFNSRGELRDFENGVSPRVSATESGSRRQAANIGLSNVGSNRPVIKQSGVQALGRETRK